MQEYGVRNSCMAWLSQLNYSVMRVKFGASLLCPERASSSANLRRAPRLYIADKPGPSHGKPKRCRMVAFERGGARHRRKCAHLRWAASGIAISRAELSENIL